MWMPRVYQHERRIVFGGSGNQRAVSIDAYNKISPDATGTVYQDTKTIANTDAHANGDELWIHFTTPVVEAARLDQINPYSSSIHAYPLLLDFLYTKTLTDTAAGTAGGTSTVRLEAIGADWDPTTLTFSNRPQRLSDSSLGTSAYESVCGYIHSGILNSTSAEAYGDMPDGWKQFQRLGVNGTLDIVSAVAAPAPTTTTFNQTARTGGPYNTNNYGVGGLLVGRSGTADNIGVERTISSFVYDSGAGTRTYTVSEAFPATIASGDSFYIFFPLYGVSLRLVNSVSNLTVSFAVDEVAATLVTP